MKRTCNTHLLLLAVAALLAGGVVALAPHGAGAIQAQPKGNDSILSPGYDLSWWTADGGGATFSTGGGYTLGGTIGQPDPGLLAGGDYNLGGGFWGGGAPAEGLHRIYLPLVMRNH